MTVAERQIAEIAAQAKSIQSALSAAGLGSLNTTTRGVLALPLYALSAFEVGRIGPKLPLL